MQYTVHSVAPTTPAPPQIHAEAKIAEDEDKRIIAQHQAMTYTKGRSDDRRRGNMGKEEYTTKGDKERAREKPKVDTKRLAALKNRDKTKDSSVSSINF